MESALDVLSRAATMVQDNANEPRVATKELPTAKWRRDRRLKTSEYQQQQHSMMTATAVTVPASGALVTATSPPTSPPISMVMNTSSSMRPLCESTNRPTPPPINSINSIESPIDMSVTSTTMKPRSSPPPPYREPLPGSNFASSLARPSVITQAPPKRGDSRDSILISNRENDNRSTESISMCETVIDEHFRRSLGPDYITLFGKKSPAASTPSPTPTPTPTPPPSHLISIQHQQHVSATITPPPPPLTLHPPQQVPLSLHRSSPTPLTVSRPAKSPLINRQQQRTQTPEIQHQQQLSPTVAAAQHVQPAIPVAATFSPSVNEIASIVSSPMSSPSSSTSSATPSVDEHFAKALGDTWKKLQADKEQQK